MTISVYAQIAWAQPLDTVNRQKKVMLYQFGKKININRLSETTLKSFKNNIISLQGDSLNHYRILDFNADTLKYVDAVTVEKLNTSEFADYILALYSAKLTKAYLRTFLKACRTEEGKELLKVLYYRNGTDKSDISSLKETRAYSIFLYLYEKEDWVFNEIPKMLSAYIDDKQKIIRKNGIHSYP